MSAPMTSSGSEAVLSPRDGSIAYMTGFENSFAGTHYSNPREFSVQIRYKFHL